MPPVKKSTTTVGSNGNGSRGSLESQTKLNEAEASLAEAEALLRSAETRKAVAEAKEAEAKAAKAKIEADREEHKRKKELASDEFFHTYLFDKSVDESSVKACIKQFAEWERSTKKSLEIDLVINSPGGSVFDGFALIDYIAGMHGRGHNVTTIAYGMAASMGGVILQAGKTRAIGASALLLIHEAQFSAFGSMGKIEDQVKMVELCHDRILTIFANRSKMTKRQIKTRWRRRDWWIDAEDCLRHGFVDEIR